MKIDILTIFPEMCEDFLGRSIIGRARQNGLVDISCVDIRDYSTDKHRKTDDTPYGGGMGMVMTAQPVYDAYRACAKDDKPYVVYMSPKGKVFNQEMAVELSKKEHIVLLCGHYEGVDQRVLDEICDDEISIGDYVLTGGEIAATVVTDAVCRLLPGVLASEECYIEESHFNGLLEYPQYTHPYEWNGIKVPDVLTSGHHENIAKWRREKSLEITAKRRPDMLKNVKLSKEDKQFLEKIKTQEEHKE